MKSAAFTLACLSLFGVQFASAASPPVEGKEEARAFLVSKMRRLIPHTHTHPNTTQQPVRLVRPAFPIPKGKFGIELQDGTKMIGVPQATSVTLKTSFGNATIPRQQITKVETANGITRVHLVNGDRVSGKWVTTVMRFDTQFGTLVVPVATLIRLSTSRSVFSSGNRMPATGNVNHHATQSAPRPRVKLDIRSFIEPMKR